MTSAVAGIVIYNPQPDALVRLVERLAGDCAAVFVYANSPLEATLAAELGRAAAPAPLIVLGDGRNDGLGAAYNAFVAAAAARGAKYLNIFDQDSTPEAGMTGRLAALFGSLTERGERPAAVGPHFVDSRGLPMWPAFRPDEARADGLVATPVEYIISSGSLIDVAAAAAVGPFRVDFFIDAIDVEWCLRAKSRGFSIWIANAIPMDHELGVGVIKGPFGLRLPYHPPQRTYTLIRNQASMLRLAHIPLKYKGKVIVVLPARIAVYLIWGRFSGALWRAVWRGLFDGLTNRLGPPAARLRR